MTRPVSLAEREHLAETLIPVAADLICRVHDDGPEATGALLASLSDEQRWALPVVLAAMVPPDRPIADLLAWTTTWVAEPGDGPALPDHAAYAAGLKPCGTHAAYVRHKKRGEPPCGRCRQAERAYQRNRNRQPRRPRPVQEVAA